jgi:hypothetical protein
MRAHPNSWRMENLKKRRYVDVREWEGRVQIRSGKLGDDPGSWENDTGTTEERLEALRRQGFTADGAAPMTLFEQRMDAALARPTRPRPTVEQRDAALARVTQEMSQVPWIRSQLEALWSCALSSDDPPFGSSSFGELTLCTETPTEASDVETRFSGLRGAVLWIATEADGGLVGILARPPLAAVVYVDNEWTVTLSGADLVDHFAWCSNFGAAFDEDEEDLATLANILGHAPPPNEAEWRSRIELVASLQALLC